MTDHQQHLTAAREAVVEAAEIFAKMSQAAPKHRGLICGVKGNGMEAQITWEHVHALRAAVANLRAVKKEMENG